jgi:hypothetical protein
VLNIAPLSRAGTHELVASSLTSTDDGVADACHDATGGNPFLLGELLRYVEVGPGGTPAPAEIRSLRPDSIRRAVLLRLAQLGQAATDFGPPA